MDDPPAAIAGTQNFLQRGMQLAQLGFRERIGPAARPDVCAEQCFIGIDVSHAVQQLLIEQRGFHGRFAGMKEPGKFLRVDTQRLSARTAEACLPDFKPPKAPRIDEPQFTS